MPTYIRGSGKEIAFQSFAPDLDPTTPGLILDANNAVPTMKGLGARNTGIAIPNGTLPAACQGAYIAQFSDEVASLFAAAGGHIYRLEAGGWVEVDAGQNYPTAARWRFAQFNDDVIATALQVFALPIPTTTTPLVLPSGVGNFVPITGSPPVGAALVISVGGFIVFFSQSSWYSSAAGVDNNYVPNIQTLAATGTLYDLPGNITAAASLYRSIIAFKNGGTWVGTFSGSPFTWSFQLISGQTGTYGQECVVTLPDSIAFLGTDDFYITTGYTPQRIPNSVKEWFFANANQAQLANVVGWYDSIGSVVHWHFVSLASPSPNILDRYVSWNVRTGRWSTGHLNVSYVVPNTQDGPFPLVGANGGTTQGGYYFDTNNRLMTWDSAAGATPGQMDVRSGWLGDESNLSELLRFRAKWNVYPTSDFGQAWHTNILGKPPVFDAAVVKSNNDWYNCRQYDRWHQVQISSLGSAELVGYAFEARVGGTR